MNPGSGLEGTRKRTAGGSDTGGMEGVGGHKGVPVPVGRRFSRSTSGVSVLRSSGRSVSMNRSMEGRGERLGGGTGKGVSGVGLSEVLVEGTVCMEQTRAGDVLGRVGNIGGMEEGGVATKGDEAEVSLRC